MVRTADGGTGVETCAFGRAVRGWAGGRSVSVGFWGWVRRFERGGLCGWLGSRVRSEAFVTLNRFILAAGLGFAAGLPISGQTEQPDTIWWSVIDSIPPGVTVLALDSLYGLEATDERGISILLSLYGPEVEGQSYHGVHQSRWRYKYQWARDEEGRCAPADVKVLLRSVIHMPHLLNEAEVDAELRERWGRYSSNLRTHEEGHREIIREALVAFRDKLLELPFRECSDYPEALQGILEETRDAIRLGTEAYDEETGHGRTQGAAWPLRGGEPARPNRIGTLSLRAPDDPVVDSHWIW